MFTLWGLALSLGAIEPATAAGGREHVDRSLQLSCARQPCDEVVRAELKVRGKRRWVSVVEGPLGRPACSADDDTVVAWAPRVGAWLPELRVLSGAPRPLSFQLEELLSTDEALLVRAHDSGPCGGGVHLTFRGQRVVARLELPPLPSLVRRSGEAPGLELVVDPRTGGQWRSERPLQVTVEQLVADCGEAPALGSTVARVLARKLAPGDARREAALKACGGAYLGELPLSEGGPGSLADHACFEPARPLPGVEARPAPARAPVPLRASAAGSLQSAALANAVPSILHQLGPRMSDLDPGNQRTLLQQLSALPPTRATFDFLVAHASAPAARRTLRGLLRDAGPLAAEFEARCEAGPLARAWPACKASSAALADVRGESRLAALRYRAALVALEAQLKAGQPSTVDAPAGTYQLVSLRLAGLAADAGDLGEARKLSARGRATLRGRGDYLCPHGLPEELKPCDPVAASTLFDELDARLAQGR